MIILQIADFIYSKANGVIVALNNTMNFEKQNNQVALFSIGDSIDNKEVREFRIENFKHIGDLPSPFNRPDIVVFNEVYKIKYIQLYKECIKSRIPYVIVPHGCLVKKAQAQKKFKKIIGNFLLFNKFVFSAQCVQFLNENEFNNSNFKINKHIISSNGIEIPTKINRCINKDLVFIGRYDIYTKGLDLILDMCIKFKDWFEKNGVRIKLFGKDYKGSYNEISSKIRSNDLKNILIIGKEIYGEEKETILCDSYAFILTSRHEGQPMGVIEALSYGLPCIVTRGTTFADYVNKNKCGIGIDFDIDNVFDAIESIYSDLEKRNDFSVNAKKIIMKDFDMKNITDVLVSKYEEIIN